MGVEVTVGALSNAPGDVHIEGQRRQVGQGSAAVAGQEPVHVRRSLQAKALAQQLHRPGAVTQAVFYLRCQFGAAALLFGYPEQRVVAKTLAAARFMQDASAPEAVADDR